MSSGLPTTFNDFKMLEITLPGLQCMNAMFQATVKGSTHFYKPGYKVKYSNFYLVSINSVENQLRRNFVRKEFRI